MTVSMTADWKVTDVRISSVGFNELGAAHVTFGWVAADADDKPVGFGELTLRRFDGWDIEAETLGADFAKKVLAFIIDSGKVIE